MKNLLAVLCLFLDTMSCQKKSIVDSQEIDEKIKVSFSLMKGDIVETDEPLITKSGGSEETTYLIHVDEYDNNLATYKTYAHGSFSSNNIAIELTKGKRYRFEVVLFKDFFKKGEYINLNQRPNVRISQAENKFTYENDIYKQFHGGITSPYLTDNGNHPIFLGETFYGATVDYIAEVNKNIELNLNRVSSYINFKVNGLTEGKVTFKIADETINIDYPNNTYETWITDNRYMNGQSSFIHSVYLNYIDPQNNITPLVSQNFTFNRNHKKTIILNLTQTPTSTEVQSNMNINISDINLKLDGDSIYNKKI